jgi:lauroyl/myristoyl acyltransferase/ADP-heptose:LPS heptosyltransferase
MTGGGNQPVLLLPLQFLGRLAAHSPEGLLRLLSHALGDGIFLLLPRRRRLILSNLHHAFPERDEAWRRRIGRESCRRLVETGLLSLALPYLGPERLRRIAWAGPELLALHARHQADPAPTLICSPHLAHWEAQTAQPLTVPGTFPEFGIIYRPLDSPAADRFVRAARERFGMRLLSRKEGFAEALKILRRRGFVGILFDQNAGLQGALTTLFGRICATTELPGLLAEKFGARVYGIYPRRHGFWRVEIGARELTHDGTSEAVTFGLNRWLENLLTTDEDLCASWLWAHDRWRHQDQPALRFRLESKRNLLAAELSARGLAAPARRTRIWIRLPNWLGDVVLAAPLLRALRRGRPDAELVLVGRAAFGPLVETWGLGDRYVALPARGPGYFRFFRRLAAEHPDVWLLFTQSLRGDLEAWCSGARQRFGLQRAGQPRPLLSHRYRVPPEWDEHGRHQLALWTEFLAHFGLSEAPDLRPLGPPPAPVTDGPIGLIVGSENFPAKRWPVPAWRGLIEVLPEARFELFGTPGDRRLAAAVADGWPAERVCNRAGETDLPGFAAALRACRMLVTNDTGGMHLANALGVPVLALFGPTNPIRTGPVFASPHRVLQPPGCPPTGGGDLVQLAPATVAAAVREMLPISGGRFPS